MKEEAILIIIPIVAAILQIILFFKVWAMTTDVRKMKIKYLNEDYYHIIRKHLALGETDKARELIINYFLGKIADPNNNESFESLKSKLEKMLQKIGETMPEKIKELKSHADYVKLF